MNWDVKTYIMVIVIQSGTSVASITFSSVTVIMDFVELSHSRCELQLSPVQQLFLQLPFETIQLQAAIFTGTTVAFTARLKTTLAMLPDTAGSNN